MSIVHITDDHEVCNQQLNAAMRMHQVQYERANRLEAEIERLWTIVGEHHTRFCSATAKHCPLCAAVQPSDGSREAL